MILLYFFLFVLAFTKKEYVEDLNGPVITQALIDDVKSKTDAWTPGYNKFFEGKTLADFDKLLIPVHEMEAMFAEEYHPSPAPPIRRKVEAPTAYCFDEDTANQYDLCEKPARNQGGCGSCWLYAATQCFEDRLCKQHVDSGMTYWLMKERYNKPNTQEVLSCHNEGSCSGGWMRYAYNYIIANGVTSDSCYNYLASSSVSCPTSCPNNATQDWNLDRGKYVQSYFSVWDFSDSDAVRIQKIKDEVHARGPVSTAYDVYTDFSSYTGGIYVYTSGTLRGGHAVNIVGWGVDGTHGGYWICKNSWGANWGDVNKKGFFSIKHSEVRINGWRTTGVTTIPCTATCGGKCSLWPSVCNQHGDCTARDQCSCHNNWSGDECKTQLCNPGCQNGACIAQDTCSCEPNWFGTLCDEFGCYGKAQSDPEVCSNKGDCIGLNQCQCDPNTHGYNCHHIVVPGKICYTIPSEDSSVCSTHGSCIDDDKCVCDDGWIGDECETIVECFGYTYDNTSFVCSGNGACTSPDKCTCNEGFKGTLCDQIKKKKKGSRALGTTFAVLGITTGSICLVLILLIVILVIVLVAFFAIKKVASKETYMYKEAEKEMRKSVKKQEKSSYKPYQPKVQPKRQYGKKLPSNRPIGGYKKKPPVPQLRPPKGNFKNKYGRGRPQYGKPTRPAGRGGYGRLPGRGAPKKPSGYGQRRPQYARKRY